MQSRKRSTKFANRRADFTTRRPNTNGVTGLLAALGHSTLSAARAQTTANNLILDLYHTEDHIPDPGPLLWPIVWLHPATNSVWREPRAFVYDLRRPDNGFTPYSVTRATTIYQQRPQLYYHLGDAIPYQVVFNTKHPNANQPGDKTLAQHLLTTTHTKTTNKAAYAASLRRFARFIMDTGCGHDLIDAATAAQYPRHLHPGTPERRHLELECVGGESTSDTTLEFQIQPFGTTTRAWVAPKSPWVLSVGRRCRTLGYGFLLASIPNALHRTTKRATYRPRSMGRYTIPQLRG